MRPTSVLAFAQLALRPELPAPAQKSSPKKKSSANSPDL